MKCKNCGKEHNFKVVRNGEMVISDICAECKMKGIGFI